MKRVKAHARRIVVGIAVVLGGAVLGLAVAPQRAAAVEMDRYRCTSATECGPGTKTCCEGGSGGGTICSTMCPIIVT